MAVRNRLMNAVFFFKDESRDLLTGKTSANGKLVVAGGVVG